MSKRKPAQALAPAVVPAPVVSEEEAKPVPFVGLEKTPKGWVVVSLVLRGDVVESEEKHCPPQGKEWAAKVLRRVLNQKVLFPNGR